MTRAALTIAIAFLWSTVAAQKAPSAKPFERFDGCVLAPDEWTDGDSFRVRLPDGRLETFRLYFVDTTESRTRGKRSDEQAAYFGLTRAEVVKLGEEAKAFTAAALQRPVSIHLLAVVVVSASALSRQSTRNEQQVCAARSRLSGGECLTRKSVCECSMLF
jgi:endonuclease YncB( thermonuclease family)